MRVRLSGRRERTSAVCGIGPGPRHFFFLQFDEVRVRPLGVLDASVDFAVQRRGDAIRVDVQRQTGRIDVIIES